MLLKERDPDTVYAWLHRYNEIGTLEKLPIEIIQLPTYAPWTNPIEKLWRLVAESYLAQRVRFINITTCAS